MSDARAVRRIAMSLPETEDESTNESLRFCVKGKAFAWSWKERITESKPRRPRIDVLAVRCRGEEKDAILSSDSAKFFTERHYQGFPAVLVRLPGLEAGELHALLTSAWRCVAPRALADRLKPKMESRSSADRDLKMSSCNGVRKVALALDGVEEVAHWDMPAFRTKRRIFITLRPREQRAMFHIPEEHQEILFAARPDAFEPLHWGKVTRCLVNLKKVPARELASLVREARDYAMTPLPGRTRRRRRIASKGIFRDKTGSKQDGSRER